MRHHAVLLCESVSESEFSENIILEFGVGRRGDE